MFQVNLVLLKIAALFRPSISQEKLLVRPDPDLFPGPVRFFLPVHRNIAFRFRSAGIFENSRLINLSCNKPKFIDYTVNSRFKKDLKLQIHLSVHKAFFLDDRFLDSLHKSNNSQFQEGKMDFLKSRVYCRTIFIKSSCFR